jgi:hypothetical protein
LAVLGTLGVLVAAVWAVPPMLDWNRFRTEIAAFAGAELGRTVVIGGDVTLRLLPQAVLTANDVTVPDQGDGMSARVASLRLEVGIWPLLAGRLVVHDLVLGSPVLTLPAALPGSVVNPARPHVPHAFAAHVENGILRTGMTSPASRRPSMAGRSPPTRRRPGRWRRSAPRGLPISTGRDGASPRRSARRMRMAYRPWIWRCRARARRAIPAARSRARWPMACCRGG